MEDNKKKDDSPEQRRPNENGEPFETNRLIPKVFEVLDVDWGNHG